MNIALRLGKRTVLLVHFGAVFASAALCLLAAQPCLANETKAPIAVFDLELLDTSLEGETSGPKDAEKRRLAMVSDLLRQLLADSGHFKVVDIAPAKNDIAAAGHLRSCNGCDSEIATNLGAEFSLTGVVQKVSNLILNINLYLRDTKSGDLIKVMSADIRGNTDESWSRGVSWLVRNRLLK